jgi:hypothetical protein
MPTSLSFKPNASRSIGTPLGHFREITEWCSDWPHGIYCVYLLAVHARPKKKYACLLSPDRPYFFTPTLKLFIGKFLKIHKILEILSFSGTKWNNIISITVESVFKAFKIYKNITNFNSYNPNSPNFKIKKILKKKKKSASDSKHTYFFFLA